MNPDSYTIEDRIELQSAYKKDYKFVGWTMEHVTEIVGPMMFRTAMIRTMSTPSEAFVEAIEEGTIGNIILTARYKYDGYIILKDQSMLGMFYAEITSIIPIVEREEYMDSKPVYLMGVFLGQTLGNLRENFINDNLVFLDSKGNVITDDKVVSTGHQIVIYDETDGSVRDRVIIVLKGDTNGDGSIDIMDLNTITMHIKETTPLEAEFLIALDIDLNKIVLHIKEVEFIHDKNQTGTMS